ncbi:MAG TPA: alpha-amylase/4-alpha-glucanotransferase domain-containing protein [Polyangia bacterium]|nr:alpha-amylase/4-alpha-glucanotransferase domain-containing protein [Polyangia bacterium]
MKTRTKRKPAPRPGLTLVLGIHNHQPAGNFGFVFERAVRECYCRVVDVIAGHPGVCFAFHFSGPLLEWLAANDPALLADVRALVARGQVEVLGSGLGEPVLAMLPPRDLAAQLGAMQELCVELLGARPRGVWLTERVWEPSLPATLAPLGVEYTFVDDHHFHVAGFRPDSVGGFHTATRHGRTVRVFPISERLRYLIPFRPLPEVFAALEDLAREGARRGGAVLSCVDDGEKFGMWPGTAEWVFERGWLDGFLTGLEERAFGLAGDPGIAIATALPGAVVDAGESAGRAALPAASYRELTEWALPAAAIRCRERLAGLLTEEAQRLLGGGFFDQFQVKYEEAARLCGRMLHTSRRLAAAEDEAGGRSRTADLDRARHALHLAQCNDAYWHGLFGGLYLPFLRQAARARLIEAERLVDGEDAGTTVERADLDLDGEDEILVRTPDLFLALRPRDGGCLTALEDRALGLALDDVLTRREEAYHDRVAAAEAADGVTDGGPRTIHHLTRSKGAGLGEYLLYDRFARLPGRLRVLDGPPDPERLRTGDQDDLGAVAGARFTVERAEASRRGVAVDLRAARCDLGSGVADVVKRWRAPSAGMGFDLEVSLEGWRGAVPVAALHLDVELTLTLDALDDRRGIAIGRGRPSPITGQGRARGKSLGLVDRFRGAAWVAGLDRAGVVAFHPIETVSVSEDGFEKIFQGTSWHLALPLHELVDGKSLTLRFRRTVAK